MRGKKAQRMTICSLQERHKRCSPSMPEIEYCSPSGAKEDVGKPYVMWYKYDLHLEL